MEEDEDNRELLPKGDDTLLSLDVQSGFENVDDSFVNQEISGELLPTLTLNNGSKVIEIIPTKQLFFNLLKPLIDIEWENSPSLFISTKTYNSCYDNFCNYYKNLPKHFKVMGFNNKLCEYVQEKTQRQETFLGFQTLIEKYLKQFFKSSLKNFFESEIKSMKDESNKVNNLKRSYSNLNNITEKIINQNAFYGFIAKENIQPNKLIKNNLGISTSTSTTSSPLTPVNNIIAKKIDFNDDNSKFGEINKIILSKNEKEYVNFINNMVSNCLNERSTKKLTEIVSHLEAVSLFVDTITLKVRKGLPNLENEIKVLLEKDDPSKKVESLGFI